MFVHRGSCIQKTAIQLVRYSKFALTVSSPSERREPPPEPLGLEGSVSQFMTCAA